MTASTQLAKNSSLSFLLPYDTGTKKHSDLRSGLKEYKFLSTALVEARNTLQSGELEKFDSLVGENACEIRAVWTSLIAKKSLATFNDLDTRVSILHRKIDALLAPEKIALLMRKGTSLEELVNSEELDLPLNDAEMFILQSYLLCETRGETRVSCNENKANSNPSLDPLCKKVIAKPEKLKRFGDVSSAFTGNLVRKLRQFLSTSSVQFVRNQAIALQDSHLIEMVSDKFTVEHNSWPCTPMFWTYQTVLRVAQNENIPLIIRAKFLAKDQQNQVIDTACILFESSNNLESFQYLETVPTVNILNKNACIVDGIIAANKEDLPSPEEWKSIIKQHSILDVILAGAADHRQYPDATKDCIVTSLKDPEYESYKEMSKNEGFSLENPTTFFIQHVYAARANHIPELVDQCLINASDLAK